MNCSAVESLLLDFIEGELDEEQRRQFQSHLDACTTCRTNVAETRDLFRALHEAKKSQERSGIAGSGRGQTARPAVPLASWSAGTILGDFEIVGEVGRGGMGVVYRAKQVSLNRIVALKVLPAIFGQSTKAIGRFQKEARAAAKLHHTNIVPVYAQGEFEGHFYYAMELIEGQSLDRVLRLDPLRIVPRTPSEPAAESDVESLAESPVALDLPSREVEPHSGSQPRTAAPHLSGSQVRGSFRKLARLISGVAEGLEHAHRQGVIHRDIKPQNLLLGDDGQLHITDFGLARLLDEPGVTVTGEMLGTPAYMSPEQVAADRKKIDHRTDIYSLGVSFYELLAGRRPFEGDSRERVIARICTDEPRPPRKYDPAVPVDLETICLRAIEKDPRRRYQSAGEMAADLRRYAEDRPILSRRVGPIEKALKWVRRHRALTAIITLSTALALTGSIVAVQRVKARHASANRLVREAFEMLAYDDYREPSEARKKLAAAWPLGPQVMPYRAATALSGLLDDPEAAVSELRAALAEDPDDTETMFLLAWALRRADQHEESRDWLRRAAAAGGAVTPAAHFFHAQAVVRTSPEEAIEAYRNACSLRKNYAQAYVHLGRALNHKMYHFRKHEDFGEQCRALESACALQPDKAYPRYLLSIAYRLSAEIYEADGRTEDAEQHFATALAKAKEAQQVEAGSWLGYTCEAEYWESRRDCRRAIAARDLAEPCCKSLSDRVELHQYRWRLHYWNGELDRAWADLQVLGRITPDADVAKVWYTGVFPSLVEAERGNIAEAVRRARTMTEAKPADFRTVFSAAAMLWVLGRGEEANRLLTDHAAKTDFQSPHGDWPAGWPAAVYACGQGSKGLDDLALLAGERRADKLLWAAPYAFLGAEALGRGDRAAALAYFRQSEQTFDYDDYCYLAKVFVRKLEQDPAWPPWLPSDATRHSP